MGMKLRVTVKNTRTKPHIAGRNSSGWYGFRIVARWLKYATSAMTYGSIVAIVCERSANSGVVFSSIGRINVAKRVAEIAAAPPTGAADFLPAVSGVEPAAAVETGIAIAVFDGRRARGASSELCEEDAPPRISRRAAGIVKISRVLML